MAKNNVFSISGKVSEINPAFGSDESLRFVGKEIEVWFCETLYEEFAGSVKTDSDNRFTLVVPAVNSVQKSRVVIFKVKDGEKYLRYTLNRSAGLDNPDLTAEIDYDNEIDVTLYIDFDSNYFTEFNHDTQVTYRLENTMHVPYSHRFVRGTLLYNSEVMQGLGTFKTNNYGYVKFAPAFSKQFYTGIKTEPERFDVLIELLDEHGESLHTASVSYAAITHPARRTTYVQVMFDVTQDPSAGSLPMAGVSATLGITLSPAVSGYFAANNINSLYDVRRIGGLRNQDALSGPEWDADKPTMDKLDGHAQFELLSKNYTVNTAAINGGYTSLHQVSRIGRSEFVTQLSAVPGVSKLDALTLHKAAYGTSAFLRNIVIERVQDARSVFAPTHYDTLQTVLDKIKEKCECDDCETGTSPFAYLADLLQYTTDHLSKSFTPLAGYSNGPVTIAGLEDIFLQPFGSMRTSCSEMKNYMCHYRLAIEILQSYRTIVGSGGACQEEAFIQAEKDFFKELYFALLNELGTDYEALREARGNTVLKQEIAESIGIVASYPGNSDTINTLTIDLSLIDPTDDVAFKAKLTLLENLFGFPSVYRDFNTTPGIPVPLITKWRKEWLRLNWLEQDFPQDEYNTRAKPLLDPDVVTVDDLSIAPEVSAADPVFNLWLKRRNFLDNKLGRDYFWNKNADDYWSPGVNKGTCTIELNYHAANDIAKGTVVTLVAKNSALGNQVSLDCIVASSVNSTSGPDITTITFLNNPAIPAGSDGYDLEYVESFDLTEIIIASASTNANSLIISGTALFAGAPALPTSGFGAGSYVEVTGAPPFVSGGSNNKKYKVGAYTAGTNIITIVSADPILTGNSGISMSDALLYARVKVAVTTLTQSTDMIPVDSAYAAEMDGRLMTIYNFDGTTNTFEADTNIPTVPSAGSWFDTKKTLHKTQGWYKMDYLLDGETWQEVGSNLSLGERTLIFNNLDLTGIDTYLAAATANSRLANGPEIVDKTINTVAFSSGLAKSLVKLDEFVPDSTNLSLVIEYPSIIISKTGSVVSFDLPDNGSFLTNMYTAGGYPQGNNTIIIEKGSTKLQVTITDVDPGSPTGLCSVDTSTAPGTEVTFTLDTPNTFTDLDDCIIRIPIKVSDIDISNKYFSVGADVTGQLAVGSQITIKHSTPNVDDRNFTVIDTAYVGTRTRIYVKEVIKSVDSDAEVSYRRTVPLLYQRANLGQFVFDFTSAINTDLRTYYSGNTNTALVWQTTLETLLPDRDRIIAGMTEAEITALENLYHLPKEAFQHLVDILEKNVKESAFDLTSQVTEAEYAEVFNILTLAFKNYLAPVWLSEEASINLYYTSFWHAFVDPVEGEVPLFNPEISALIDPSAAGDSALPEPRFGKTAIDIYNKRKEQVDNVTDLLRKVAANNFPGLINMVLGDGVSTTGLGVDLVQLLSDLNSIDAQRSATANSIVSNNFKLTAANFQALMQLRTRSGSNNPPSASEIESALAWLADVYCKRRLTGLWNAEEATVRAVIHNSSPPDYKLLDNWWLAKKAVLPKWRTSAESRSSWKQALAKKNLAPAIEPDLVLDTDIAIINGPVFDFWVNRREAVAIKIAAITAAVGLIPSGLTTSNDDKFNTGITNALNVINAAEFHNLETLKDKGEDIRRYLNHMRLSNGAYERLLRLKTLGYSTWLNEEKDEFYSILVQAWKEWKWYGVWNSEEQASSIIVSPDYFAIPTPEYAPNAMDFYTKIPKWRATWKARSAWEKKLKGREDQYGNVDDQVKTLIKNVEDSVLLSYQDALVNLIGDEMLTLEQNATNLSKRLLVDFNIRCCQTTTRLSQAIDTIQKLIWTESVGIDQKEIPAGGSILRFTLNANNFEDEWCWMGSYATWRAAMFVFMFPENLLIPTLRKWQSPAFRNLVSEVRGNDRLTPVAACHAAKKYSEYYEDVANLDPQCTCTAIAKTTGDDCVNGSIQNAWCTFFTFALSKKTKKAYFSTRNYMEQNTMSSFSYWAEIESLGKDITQLLGASVYENEVNRYIFLFATITEEFEEKLVFVKYDLDKGDWDDDFTGLDVPEETDFGKIKILQRNRATEPPKVLIHTTGTDEMLVNSLNKLGKKWDSNKWKEYFTTGRNKIRLKEVYAFIEVYHGTSNGVNYYNEVAIALPEDGKNYIYRAFGPSDNGKWEQATWGPGKFVGAVCLNIATKDIQIITRPSGSAMNINTVIRVGRLRNILQRANPTALIASFEDLDAYMIDVAGVGLRHLQFQNSGPTGGGQTYLQLIARLRLYIPAAQITTYPDQFTLPLDPTSNPSYANKANGQVTGWYTFLEAFQNFQMYYTRFRAFDQEYADKWRELCDNLLNFLVTTVFTGSQTDPWPRDHLVPALRQVMMNIGQQSPVFYTSTNNIVRKKLTLANVMHSLLNFTFDENGEIRNSPDDENYPKPYVTILGVRIDGGLDAVPDSSLYIARPGKNVTRICPNWGMQPMTAKKMADTYNYYAYTIEETINEDYFTGTLSINYAARAIVKNDPTAPFFKYMDLNGTSAYHLNPFVSAYYEITEDLTSAQLQLRKTVIDYLYLKNTQADYPVIHREYLREAYYFIPFYLGQQLSQRGHYQEALEWFKTVYDYTTEGEANRRLYNAVQMDSPNFDATPDRAADWLLDPLNPHALAATRENAYYKYTLYTIAQTFSAWADAQFTLDTVETVSQAGSLYQVAEDLLSLDVLKQLPAPCTTNIFDALTQLFCEHPELKPFRNLIERIIAGIPTGESFEVNEAIEDVLEILTTGPGDVYQRLKDAEDYVEDLQDEAAGVISISVSTGNAWNVATQMGALSIGGISGAVTSISSTISTGIMHGAVVQYGGPGGNTVAGQSWMGNSSTTPKDPVTPYTTKDRDEVEYLTEYQLYKITAEINPIEAFETVSDFKYPYIPFPDGLNFCIPVNPVYQWQLMSVQLNQFKIRNCMNIAGMKRDLDPYAAPTDLYTGLPQISGDGKLVLPGLQNIQPTIYRYEFLVERAKQIVNIAQQIEANFLASLEKEAQEAYSILKAKQDLAMSKANVKLKDLQLVVANDQVDLAQLQKDKSQLAVDGLEQMIDSGLNSFEQAMIGMYYAVAAIDTTLFVLGRADDIVADMGDIVVGIATNAPSKAIAAAARATLLITTAILEGTKNRLNADISASSIWAAQERRKQEWTYQKTLAQQDVKIGAQQVKIAQDGVRVAKQDHKIAELQQTHSEATIDFLNNKFTNRELYEWMSKELARVYSYFLQQGTSVAKLAENQLAFERQEQVQTFIQSDYWEAPGDSNALQAGGGSSQDRRGLTGSSRLLMDIYQLDQYAVLKDKRKLQISKTFSLATKFPMEFQIFKATGVLNFETDMNHFDVDFPGHYLRLIKKVKVSVIALIPPVDQIKAMLISSGNSHVVIGGQVFQDMVVRRSPEFVALSGTRDATGVFEMQMQDQRLLNPFEANGVHTRWELRMPKASNLFDYHSINDVLFTIDYTALYSPDYEQQVIRELGTDFASDRVFSFRNDFADQYYTLCHPEESDVTTRMKAAINVGSFDFPANVSELAVTQVKLYYLIQTDDPTYRPFENRAQKEIKLTFRPDEDQSPTIKGNANVNKMGIISTLTNGGGFVNTIGHRPVGSWEFDMLDLQDLFEANSIYDVVMVITYSGNLPVRN